MDLKNASALVTGGAGGLGSATARRLAEAGARVVIADVADERGEALAKQLGNGSVSGDTLVDRFEKLERDEKIERLLGELKQKQGRMLEAG